MDVKHIIKFSTSTRKIGGWFDTEAALLIGILDTYQKTLKITGNIFEIGVHFGKRAVFFNNLLGPSEEMQICDIFENQTLNASGSGFGSKIEFLNNMDRYGKHPIDKIHHCLSSDLTIKSIGTNYRLFHIDGGHNKDEALFDLTLAAKCLHDKGVIIVDDPFRHDWPGVTEAIISFLEANDDFRAFAVGFNKLLIAKKSFAAECLTHLDNKELRKSYRISYPYGFKKVQIAGSIAGSIYHLPQINPKSIKYRLYAAIKRILNK